MKTIRTTAVVDADHRATIQMPEDVAPGEHRVLVVIEGEASEGPASKTLVDFPVIDVGRWPEGLSLRREEMYGDDGR
jgi:hypothetical protein